MKGLLELLDVASQSWFVAAGFELLADLGVLLVHLVKLDLLLVDDSPQRINYQLKFSNRFGASASQLDCLARPALEFFSSQFGRLLADSGKLLFSLVLQDCRELVRLKLVLLEISDALLESSILKVECFLLELEVEELLVGLEELLLQRVSSFVAFCQIDFEFFDALRSRLFLFFSLSDSVHRKANDHLELVSLILQFLSRVLEPVFQVLLFCGDAAEFGSQRDLNRLLQGLVDLLSVENLIFEPLDLIGISLGLRLLMHLTRWFRISVNKFRFELPLLGFKLEDSIVHILDFLLGDQDLIVSLLDLLLQRFQVLLVFLLNFPVLEGTSSTSVSHG